MKIIKYQFLSAEINRGTEEAPDIEQVFLQKIIPCPDDAVFSENLAIAKREAYNGEYTIEDDGEPEPAPTQLDRIEAQTTYTAMMTDTLLEG